MKVGNYVITNDRLHIGKIYNINEFREPSMIYAIDFPNEDDFIFMGDNDFKSSSNIIDLIESDDYVNGYKVLNVIKFNDNSKALSLDKIYNNKITNKDIKSIVTKEQFESMEYKVVE